MASYNAVFAIDVDYRSEDLNFSTELYQNYLKQWILRVLLALGSKYGFEKIRWGYRFFHSRSVKSAGLITRATHFKELQEKAFSEFEGELQLKVCANKESTNEEHTLQSSPATCVQNTLKEILLDFQWDRPDITSPTKLTLRPRRSSRTTTNISLAEDDFSCQDKNLLFVVSKCPHSSGQLGEFLQLRNGEVENHKDLSELVLPKRLTNMIVHRKVLLYWVDCSHCKVNVGDDYTGLKTIMGALHHVAGKVIPMLTPGLTQSYKEPDPNTLGNNGLLAFPSGSSTGCILSSEKTYNRVFPPLIGTLGWATGENRQTCSVLLESVSCRQRSLGAPVEVTLQSVLYGLDTRSLTQYAPECWVLSYSHKSEQNQAVFECLLNELFVNTSVMLAEVSEGGLVHSAVLSVLSSHMALLTVLQPLKTEGKEVLSANLVSSETADMTDCTDLPDIVCSVLNAVIKDEDSSESFNQHQIPEWANQDLQQWPNMTDFTECWFPLSDQSGISSHLMESMRLLHAAPEKQEQNEEHAQLELTHSLVELYQNKTGPNSSLKGKKRAQRTPVRQKMKTMSRSLQMLNVARFNVKAQKGQTETDSSSSTKETEKRGRSCLDERTKAGPMHFKNEEELLSHLKLRYQQAVEDRSVTLINQVQDLLSVVKTFISNNTDTGASFLDFIKKNLLKSAQSIRQLYGSVSDTESKIKDCQLQVVLRLELCRPPFSDHQDHVEQMVEEVAGMLRIISLTNDPVYLSKFMQEEVMPLYLNSIPKILADTYHSLGTQLPEVLVAVLPSDFFSDDSMAKDSVSVSPASLSATQSLASSVGDRLEELRNRSAKKRSKLTRHKSMTEAPQTRRQIEMPRKSTRQAKPKCVPVEKLNVVSQPTQKQAVQEVTKVRRNLFNQENMTPSKKSKMPRSQSVSAVEGVKKRKRIQIEDEHTALLTKKVSETPLHKQVSNRLLHRQRTGRRSGESDLVIVEESPVKPAIDLRRSPRIKKLARRHSSVFYSSSQPRSRNLDRALSSSQLPASEGKGGINIRAVKSPVRLLFGAAESPGRPTTSTLRTQNAEAASTDYVFEDYNKSQRKSPYKQLGNRTPRTPSSSCKAQNSPFSKSPGHAVGENGMTLRGSPFRALATKSFVLETPKKSPLKGILRTPVKSPNMRTPKKSVTWSPSPKKHLSENAFKVPESPQISNRYSPRLMSPGKLGKDEIELFKTPEKSSQQKSKASPETVTGICQNNWSSSPWKHLSDKPFKVPDSPQTPKRFSPRLMTPDKLCRDQFAKTPEKSNHQKSRMSPKTPQRASEIRGRVDLEEPKLGSEKIRRNLHLQKSHPKNPEMLSVDASSPQTPELKTPSKNSGSPHMCTRSGKTPIKRSSALSSNFSPSKGMGSSMKVKSPETPLGSLPLGSHPSVGTNYPRTSLKQIKNNQTRDGESFTTNVIYGQNESLQETMEEGSSSDTQHFDSSQFSGTTTEESIDIAEASVVKTELTGGIKMNISFSRKPSKSSEVFEFTGTQAHPGETTQERRYGFRQTPDRQQRRAAARLGYSAGLPVFSTPRASRTPADKKKQQSVKPNPLTYEVELEMQASGLPKLKFKRTDSFNSNEASECAAKVLALQTNAKASGVNSPLAHCYKHKEPSCISPSHCTHETPGMGGFQTFICQAITPTRPLTNSPSPVAPGEPWTPSPRSLGRLTPENFSKWPRKKRAKTCLLPTKESAIKEKTGLLEDPDLEGVYRLQGTEELKESVTGSAWKYTLAMPSKLCPSEEMDCLESVVPQCNQRDNDRCDELSWISATGSLGSAVTPPPSKVRKPVSASGIFALTQSPLLYKGKKVTLTKETTQSNEPSGLSGQEFGDKSLVTFDVSPFSQPQRHQRSGRTYSRKRLLDS